MTKLDTLLYWYTLSFSAALIISGFSGGINSGELATIAFFLPVPAYLLLQALKRYYLWRQTTTDHQALITFHPKKFLTQSNPAFIFSLILLLTAWFISLVRSL